MKTPDLINGLNYYCCYRHNCWIFSVHSPSLEAPSFPKGIYPSEDMETSRGTLLWVMLCMCNFCPGL